MARSPAKKKPRIAAAPPRSAVAAVAASSSSSSSSANPSFSSRPSPPSNPPGTSSSSSSRSDIQSLLRTTQSTSDDLIDTLDSIESSGSATLLPPLLASASSNLLTLKSAQRSLCLLIERKSSAVRSKRAAIESRSMQLQNLTYERDVLVRKTSVCRDYETDCLEKMCRDELGSEEGMEESKGVGGGGGRRRRLLTAEDATNAFLLSKEERREGKSYRDPSRHGTTISRLHGEFGLRKQLGNELAEAERELEELRRSVATRRKFLEDVPERVAELERVSSEVQKHFLASSSSSSSGGSSDGGGEGGLGSGLTGSERNDRLNDAAELAGPLYTLFRQLQGYLDAFGTRDGPKVRIAKDKRGVDGAAAGEEEAGGPPSDDNDGDICSTDGAAVCLDLPLPDASSFMGSAVAPDTPSRGVAAGKKKNGPSSSSAVVTVTFEYLPKLRVVTAEASSEGDDRLDADCLLAELFPRDDGVELPNGDAFFRGREWRDDDGGDGDDRERSVGEQVRAMKGRPYQWANYIAGLLLPSPAAADDAEAADADAEESSRPKRRRRKRIEPSTRAVVRALASRIRSAAALGHLLHLLERKKPNPVPVHPALNPEGGGNGGGGWTHSRRNGGAAAVQAKLVGWTETTKASSSPSAGTGRGRDRKKRMTYVATIKRKSSSLRATVTIGPTYPERPPVWSLQPSFDDDQGPRSVTTLQSCTNPLYDNALGSIERSVNDAVYCPEEAMEGTGGDDDDGDPTSCSSSSVHDWILVHQLRDVMERWDASQAVAEGGNDSGGRVGGSAGGGGRSRRGRDRVIVA